MTARLEIGRDCDHRRVHRSCSRLEVMSSLAPFTATSYFVGNLPREAQPMSDAFLSSDDFDEQAHHLYNEGRYDEALTVLKEGIALYPHAVQLHIGRAYAHLAREEFAWSRRSYEQALALDPDHEDGLAGLGESLL